jgi:hypothetical protein
MAELAQKLQQAEILSKHPNITSRQDPKGFRRDPDKPVSPTGKKG